MKNFIHKLVHEESGQDLVEYALVAALVGLGAVTSLNSLASGIAADLGAVGNTLTIATS